MPVELIFPVFDMPSGRDRYGPCMALSESDSAIPASARGLLFPILKSQLSLPQPPVPAFSFSRSRLRPSAFRFSGAVFLFNTQIFFF